MQHSPMDAVDIVERALLHREAIIGQLAELADTTDDPLVAIRAIDARARVADGEVALLQAIGALPTPLSCVGQHIDVRRLARDAVDVLTRTGFSPEIKRELLDVLNAASG